MSKRSAARRSVAAFAIGCLSVGVAVAAPGVAVADGVPQPVVSSTVFPPDGQPGAPLIRTPGTFTFSVPAGSGVVAFDYVLNGTLAVPGSANAHVAVGADGTATTPVLRSAQWGTNVLTVQAEDASGALSTPTTYLFYLVSPGQADRYSDYDGDGNIDLLSVGADGALRFSGGRGDGSVADATDTLPGVDLTGALIAGGGDQRTLFQDLYIFQNGHLTGAVGQGLGDFTRTQEVDVQPPSGLSAWPALTQLLSPGDLTGRRRSDLIGKVGDQLFLFPAIVKYHYGAPVAIAGSGWSGRTVVGVVANANGGHDLIARDDASGKVWRYPGQAGGTFGDESTRVLVGGGLSAKNFPHVIAKGDANGDGLADIWAVHKNGDLFVLPGLADGCFGEAQNVANHSAWADVATLG